MIKIIGTNHLMSKEEIYEIIKKENPDVIGVELCSTRFNLLVMPKLLGIENNTQVTEKRKDDTLIGKIADKLNEKSNESNLEYGSDMINSSIYAKENKIPLELLDMDITRLKELMEKIPEKEINGFLEELQKFEKMSMQEVKDQQTEEKVNETINELKINYPISYEFLITMRELIISNNILRTINKYPSKKILIILGMGHIKSIEEHLK